MESEGEKLLLGCYVDDMFTLHSNGPLYARFVAALCDRWKVEDEGPVSDLLNVEITKLKDVVSLRQTSYIDKMVESYLPDGVPDSFKATETACRPELSS